MASLSVVRSGNALHQDAFLPTDVQWSTERYPGPDGRVYFPDAAVVEVRVRDVPVTAERPEGKPYDLRLVHEPYSDHYPHAEVRVYKDDVEILSESKIKVRNQLRQAFADIAAPSPITRI